MKKIINILIVISITFNTFALFINNVDAATYTVSVTDKEGLNIRSGPSTSNSVVASLSYKAIATLVSTTKKTGTGCSGGWYQINYNNSTSRYICSNYTSTPNSSSNNTTISQSANYYTSNGWEARISEDYAYVRSSSSTSSTLKDTIYMGTTLNILGTATGTGCSSGWYKVSYYNNRIGYVCQSLVEKYNTITASDATYNKTLQAAGFPESYWPYLTYLHKKHPKWIFKASQTNKAFSTVISGESGKNYIQSKESAYITSLTEKEPGWRVASNAVNAYFLDPRNYLTEKNIFAFEYLAYDKTNQTSGIVKNIFGSSYLSADSYVNYFMQSASSYNVSPVHLASRVKKEGGTNSSYDAVSGTSTLKYNGQSLTGIYNYYNIGAYKDSITSSPVTRGLAAAKGLVDNQEGTPWNTREKAIKYGAKFIASSYINKGQNTLYYQKFNTGPNNGYSSYTHQYMTNIIAPASESLYMSRAYDNANVLDSSFVFYIPVYTSMPSNYTIHPPIGNTNNDLSSIKVNGTTINGFDNDVIAYNHYIPSTTKTISLTATPAVSSSTISGTGTITTSSTNTTAKITVTSQVGTKKIYTINLIKTNTSVSESTKVEDIIKKVNVNVNSSYMSGFVVNTTATTLSNNINKQATSAQVTITDRNKRNKTSKLATGDIITIKNGTSSKTYTIVLKGDTNGDGVINTLDLLNVKKHILGYTKLSNANKEAADTNYNNSINTLDLLNVKKHILGYTKLK